MSWKKVRLGEVLSHRKGFITINDNAEYKLCRVQLHRRGVVLREMIKGKTIRTKKQQICKSGDFLVAEMDAKVGGYGFVPEELEGAIVSSHYYLFELDEDKIRPRYLEVVSKLLILQEQIKATGSTNYAAIRPIDVLNWEIPLPDVGHQIRIENLYEITDKKGTTLTAELTHQLDLVKQLRQAFLREAMQGKLVEQDPKDEPASELLKKIKTALRQAQGDKKNWKQKGLPPIKKDEISFEVPESWVWCRLGTIAEMCLGKMLDQIKNKGSLQPYLRNTNVRWGGFDLSDLKEMRFTESEEDRFSIIKEDLVICEGGEPGRAAIWENETPIKFQKALHRVRVNGKVLSSKYLFYCILSDANTKRLIDYFTGAGIQHLTGKSLSKYAIPLPPLPEQHRIVAKLEQLMHLCDDLEQSIRQSKEQTNMLLQSALREALQPKAKIIQLPVLQKAEDKAFLKRKVLATYIINQSLNDPYFGDTKFEKLLHLADHIAIKRNLNQKYIQKVAGPYDNSFTYPYFEQVEKSKWFIRKKDGSRYFFKPGQSHLKSMATYNLFSEDELKRVDKIINYFKNSTYEKPEIASTLYAVWNNRIIQQQEINDNLLIEDFYKWDENKKRYERAVLERALQWMRQEGLVPDGWGKVILKAGKEKVGNKL
ncbi:MAG: restriction endonuclease subunit S [Nitrospirae bacterium]|nr:restriction endonuclease subunit S [Nitrospirota bacterium]